MKNRFLRVWDINVGAPLLVPGFTTWLKLYMFKYKYNYAEVMHRKNLRVSIEISKNVILNIWI